MQCLRPIGLVLMATLSLVYSMPSETTTTRYTSFEGYDRFPLTSHSDKNIFLNLTSFSIPFHFSDTNPFNKSNHEHRLAKEPKNDEFYDKIPANSLESSSSFKDDLEEGRKLKKFPKDRISVKNLVKKPVADSRPPNRTLSISTVNKMLTKTNKTSNTSINKPIKINKLPNQKVPGSKKNSSILLSDKNMVSIATTKGPFRIRLNKITTTKPTPKIKYKVSTSAPILIKLTKFTTQRPRATTQKYTPKPTKKLVSNTSTRPNVRSTTPSYKRKQKPTVHKIITKWSDTPDLSEIKQNWYEPGVPYPNPNPEISSFSPPVSLNDLSSVSPLSGDFVINYPNPNPEVSSFSPPISLSDLSSISPLDSDLVDYANYPSPMPEVSSYSPSYSINDVPPISQDVPDVLELASSTPASTTAVSNPINVFNLDMVPDRTKQVTGGGSPCPEVHISSSVLTRQQRQDCSDLNLVINSHFHQNQNAGGTRNPAINTYDAAADAPVDPVAADVGQVFADPGVGSAADPGVGTASLGNVGVEDAVNSAAAIPQAATGGTGGSGGSGGSGGDGNGGGLKLPDLKNLFDTIGYIWNALGSLLRFLSNPYLYIIPIALFFSLGFFTVLALFPWWIPLLLIYLGIKSHKKPKDTVSFYKHVHKPVYHADGWFWNHQTKTWQNVQDFVHKKRIDGDKRVDNISEIIKNIRNKYANDNTSVQSWKRRRKPK